MLRFRLAEELEVVGSASLFLTEELLLLYSVTIQYLSILLLMIPYG